MKPDSNPYFDPIEFHIDIILASLYLLIIIMTQFIGIKVWLKVKHYNHVLLAFVIILNVTLIFVFHTSPS